MPDPGFKIKNILAKYYQDKNNDVCWVCASSQKTHLISNTCECKNINHLECLIEIVSKFGDKCTVCKKNNNSVYDTKNNIIFPKDNIYTSTLFFGSYTLIDKYDMCKCLKYAIGNLQIDRIKVLLSQMDDRMISQYIKTMQHGVHKNNSLELIDCMFTNVNKEEFQESFYEIEKILKKRINTLNKNRATRIILTSFAVLIFYFIFNKLLQWI